jgi:cytoskeletal protein RodZ
MEWYWLFFIVIFSAIVGILGFLWWISGGKNNGGWMG